MRTPEYSEIRAIVLDDLAPMDFADKPIDKYAEYSKTKYVDMATKLAQDWFWIRFYNNILTPYWETEMQDFIHGLNHCFMWGVAAGQNVEKNVNQG